MTAVGLLAVLVITLVVFGIDPQRGLSLIIEGAFGNRFGLARTFVRATPLLLCGLGMTLAWKSGMYNIGGEGQYVAGGIAGAVVARSLSALVPSVFQTAVLVGSMAGGMALALFAGWLQVKRGVQCVISTILLNFVVLQALAWCVRGPLQESKHELPLSDKLPDTLMLARFDHQTDFHAGVFVALGVALGTWVYLTFSRGGFLLKLVGENPLVARANRIPAARIQMTAMALSGALCGLGGGVDYLGITGQIGDGFSQNWGFLAIPVALLGGLNPFGVVGSSLYFGALMAGGEGLARFNTTGSTLVSVIQAVAVLGFVAFSQLRMRRPAVPHD